MLALRRLALPATAASIVALTIGAALADPPPADTIIGNQATATYTADGQTFTVQSNVVETVVNEIAGLDMSTDQSRGGAPGSLVFFPHVISNDGNAPDIFDLTTDAGAGDDFALSAIQVFADADQDGQPDSLTPITVTPEILAGDTFGIVIRAEVPAGVDPSTSPTSDFEVTATSQNDPSISDTNTDTVTASAGGLIDLQKEQSLAVDADGDGVFSEGDTVEVTIDYRNTGISAATNVLITDTLPVTNDDGETVALDYVAGTGLWGDTGATALSDTLEGVGDPNEQTNTQGDGLKYGEAAGVITAIIDNVDPGRSGTITFRYTLTTAPEGMIENIALVETDDQTSTPSNPSPVTIAPTVRPGLADAELAVLGGSSVGDSNDAAGVPGNISTTDDDGAIDDTVTEGDDTFPGGTVAFDMVLTNLGDANDTFEFDLTNPAAGAGGFPAGTTFAFVGADGTTPVVGNRVNLDAGEATHLQVIATLPTSTAPVAAAGAGDPPNFTAVATATSITDPSQSNQVDVDFTGAVIAPPVDLTNTDGAGTVTGGAGSTPGDVSDGGDPWTTLAGDPGATVVFPLRVSLPAGAPPNTFDLTYSQLASFANSDLPDGWTVTFHNAAGQEISSTGTLSPTATTGVDFDYEARVTIAPDAAATGTGFESLYFRATSPINGATDTKLDGVEVNEIVDLSIFSDTVAQAAPGGTVVIPHTITNLGNSEVTDAAIDVGTGDSFDQGLTAAIFWDANDDGVLDAGDPVVTNISDLGGLQAGESARVFLRSQVPDSVSLGLVETGDIDVGASGIDTVFTAGATDADTANNEVVDTISIISGDVTVVKETAVVAADPSGNCTAGTAFTVAQTNADPGDCITYRITVDNTGTTDATDVVINDITPDWTSIETCGGACDASFTVDGGAPQTPAVFPGDEASGLVASSTAGSGFTLPPGARAMMTFTVQIDE